MGLSPMDLEQMNRDYGLVHNMLHAATTVATTVCATAPGTGYCIVLRGVIAQGSAAATCAITEGTIAATTAWRRNPPNVGWYFDDAVYYRAGDNCPLNLHVNATPGNNTFDVYYTIHQNTGTR